LRFVEPLALAFLLAFGPETFQEAWRLVGGGGVAVRTECTDSAASACVRALPRLIGMVLAHPAGVFA
jgi:hypothetical protein